MDRTRPWLRTLHIPCDVGVWTSFCTLTDGCVILKRRVAMSADGPVMILVVDIGAEKFHDRVPMPTTYDFRRHLSGSPG